MMAPMLAAMATTGWVLQSKCGRSALAGPDSIPADSAESLLRRYPAAAATTISASLCAGAVLYLGL